MSVRVKDPYKIAVLFNLGILFLGTQTKDNNQKLQRTIYI